MSQPWARAQPPSESIAIYNWEVGRRLAAAGEEVEIVGPLLGDAADGEVEGVSLRYLGIDGDWRLRRLLEPVERRLGSRLPLFATRAFFPLYVRRVAALLAERPPDVVHVHNLLGAVPVLRRALPRARIVLHLHAEWLGLLPRRLSLGPARAADAIVGPSRYVVDAAARALPELAGRIAVAPNGVDTALFTPAAEGERESARIIAVGRISPEKGIHVLLDAFGRLLERLPQARLALVGKEALTPPELLVGLSDEPAVQALSRFYPGPYLEPLLQRAGPAVGAAVDLVGEVGHTATAAEYRRSALVVNSSLSESFGLSAIEGMASGLPVVATRAGGLPETVEDGVTGLLVEPGDAVALAAAMERALGEPELAAGFGAAGRERALARYDWSAAATAAREIYAGTAVAA
ncbi:MAG TPA: glycosyltransferase family 4 protein [Solirubrobacterales bacterium]|nr:glycosyltransferase family 4 protein [Solirubrobacterales bacterium]